MTNVTVNLIKKTIFETLQKERNMVPSEIVFVLQTKFPHYNSTEFKQILKDLQKNHLLVNDIIYGGLRLNW